MQPSHPAHRIIYFLGIGLGSGLSPKAPGTVASAVILLLMPLWLHIGFYVSLTTIVVMSLVGIYICAKTAHMLQVHDDGRIVWDEFAGQSIALLPIIYAPAMQPSHLLLQIGCAFVLFRLFDIVKPWPIRWLDQHVHGGFGIMADDVLAGIFAAIILCFIPFWAIL